MEKIKSLFKDRKNRYILLIICCLPMILVGAFFGFRVYKEYKNIKSLVSESGEAVVTNDHKIESMNYLLRDNDTDYQLEIFAELKNAVEKEETEQSVVAGMVVKNFVADFFTWSNKLGQYDVGGMYYVPKYSRENIYTKARDTFYKYINEYMDKYGSENLLEVTEVNITKTEKMSNYDFLQIVKYYNLEDDWDFNEYTREEIHSYVAYKVDATWSYKEGTTFMTSKYPTSSKFIVVYNNELNRFEIVSMNYEGGTN